VESQLNIIAFELSSIPITGNAILIDEPIKAVINAVSVVISRINLAGGCE
jgi:hypothetical protein